MPKFLKDEVYDALANKAANYDSVVEAVVANSDGLTAEEVTVEVITSAIASESVENTESANRITELEEQVASLTLENTNLKNGPGDSSSSIIRDVDEGGSNDKDDVSASYSAAKALYDFLPE
jgi:stalled ribosome rescue protein Dom34